MVERDFIKLSKLSLEELSGVVGLYPWCALARAELCRRVKALPGEVWDKAKYASQALYFPDREVVFEIMRGPIQPVIAPSKERTSQKSSRQVFVIGGDYFTPAQYEGVRMEEDDIFSSFASKAALSEPAAAAPQEDFSDYCTETLANVYLEQGYKQEAKEIYSKLSLLYPEKSVYFASLIEKIDKVL